MNKKNIEKIFVFTFYSLIYIFVINKLKLVFFTNNFYINSNIKSKFFNKNQKPLNYDFSKNHISNFKGAPNQKT